MKRYVNLALFFISGHAAAASIPTNLVFPLKNNPEQKEYRMADHPNSVFVFESYAHWCGACNDNASNVDELATKYADNARVQVLDASLDDTEEAFKDWIDTHKPNHPVIQDVSDRVYKALRTDNYIPQVFVVNCKGERVGSYIGVWDHSVKAKLDGYIATALATTCEK
jgi:thiol-disulfide isomerase/thioredoxin